MPKTIIYSMLCRKVCLAYIHKFACPTNCVQAHLFASDRYATACLPTKPSRHLHDCTQHQLTCGSYVPCAVTTTWLPNSSPLFKTERPEGEKSCPACTSHCTHFTICACRQKYLQDDQLCIAPCMLVLFTYVPVNFPH